MEKQHPSTYFVDPEHPAEMVRLRNQDRLFTKNMGGVLNGQDLSEVQAILDIACGSGGWVLEVAYEHPDIQVIGLDMSERMVTYANEQAKVLRLENAHFQVMDATRPLDFADRSFDFVNSRLIASFMPNAAWPRLFAECRRILRPGGTLRMTEYDRALTNNLSHERVSTLFCQSQFRLGTCLCPDGNHLGILPMLGFFFQQAGFEHIQTHCFSIDFSFGAEAHNEWYQDLLVLFKLAQPLMVRTNMATQEELDRLYNRLTVEMDLPDFRAILLCMSVWGSNPQK